MKLRVSVFPNYEANYRLTVNQSSGDLAANNSCLPLYATNSTILNWDQITDSKSPNKNLLVQRNSDLRFVITKEFSFKHDSYLHYETP